MSIAFMHILLSTFLFCSGLTLAATPSYPVLTYSTYLRDSFTPNAIATDAAGNIYMAGNAIVDPATSQTTALVVKLNPQATQYLYVRYLGGSVKDQANAMSVDSSGNAYIAALTSSPDFPVTGSSNLPIPPPSLSTQRSFIAKLNSSGDLVFSDLIGGIAVSVAQAGCSKLGGSDSGQRLCRDVGFPLHWRRLQRRQQCGASLPAGARPNRYDNDLFSDRNRRQRHRARFIGQHLRRRHDVFARLSDDSRLMSPSSQLSTFAPVLLAVSPNQGANQYVTKVDPTGSKLIYSTALSGSGQTTNAGLAVDASGRRLRQPGSLDRTYPFTVLLRRRQSMAACIYHLLRVAVSFEARSGGANAPVFRSSGWRRRASRFERFCVCGRRSRDIAARKLRHSGSQRSLLSPASRHPACPM